jgi:hypothetical protein
MTNLVPNGGVAQVPEIEVSTPLLGGPGGPLNQQSQGILNAMLMAWALTQSVQLVSASRDSNEAIVTANIVWPDGSPGVFTTDIASTEFLGAIDAWHATYINVATLIVTQPQVTRDTNGAVTNQPAIQITLG